MKTLPFWAGFTVSALLGYFYYTPSMEEELKKPVSEVKEVIKEKEVVRYNSNLSQLLKELGYDELVMTYCTIPEAGADTAIGTRTSINTLAVRDPRLLGKVFWVDNVEKQPDFLPRVFIGSDKMPTMINGKETAINRVDKYTWMEHQGRTLYHITGVRKIQGMEVIVLQYGGATRKYLGH